MRIRFNPMVLMAAAAISMTLPARADVSLTMHTTMQNATLDRAMASIGPAQKKLMSDMLNSKISMSGKRYRMDNAIVSMIMDASTKQMTMFSNSKRTYCTVAANPDSMKAVMDRSGVKMPMDSSHYKVTDTGKTTLFHGHKCRHYIMTMTMTMPGAGTMTAHYDILAAQDMPGLDADVFQAMSLQMGIKGDQVKGVPLETIATVTGGSTGSMTVKQEAIAISTDPIPSSTFDVPAGYQETSQADFFPAPPAMPAPPVQQ